jgi:hypothetical protein
LGLRMYWIGSYNSKGVYDSALRRCIWRGSGSGYFLLQVRPRAPLPPAAASLRGFYTHNRIDRGGLIDIIVHKERFKYTLYI